MTAEVAVAATLACRVDDDQFSTPRSRNSRKASGEVACARGGVAGHVNQVVVTGMEEMRSDSARSDST